MRALNFDRIDGAGNMDTRIANAMKVLGFVKHRETTGTSRPRGWKRRPPQPPLAAPGKATAATNEAHTGPSASEDDDLPL